MKLVHLFNEGKQASSELPSHTTFPLLALPWILLNMDQLTYVQLKNKHNAVIHRNRLT